MSEMSMQTRETIQMAIAHAQMRDKQVDTDRLMQLDSLSDEEAVAVIDEVFREIHGD